MHFANILFPVDFSARCRAIVPHVRAVASRFDASLTLLNLIEMPVTSYGSPEAPVMFDYPYTEVREVSNERLRKFADAEFPGVPVKIFVDRGDPGSCIAELARLWGADLIMLPTRGCGRFRAALLGSVTAKTLHDAACPVWTEAHCEEIGDAHLQWRKIVCAIDSDAEGARLIRFAADLAKSEPESHLCLVHSVAATEECASFLEDRAHQTIAAMQKEAGTNFPVTVQAGNVPETIRREASTRHADLVLIGRGAMPHFAGRLRSHAYPIVRDMPCPVLSI